MENGKPGEKRVQQESGGRVKVRTPQEKNVPICRTKTAKAGHPNLLGELKLRHPRRAN